MPLHKDLTGAELHEPKGVESAIAGTVYVADGVGSGQWSNLGGNKVTLTVLTSEGGNLTIPNGSNLQQALQIILDFVDPTTP